MAATDWVRVRARQESLVLLVPGLVVLVIAFLFPVGTILITSVLERAEDGTLSLTASHFAKFFVDDYYLRVAWRTLRLALVITLTTAVLGVPLAYIMRRARPILRFAILLTVILPLMTSVVIRTFGWLVVLGNGGLLASLVAPFGFTGRSAVLMHTENRHRDRHGAGAAAIHGAHGVGRIAGNRAGSRGGRANHGGWIFGRCFGLSYCRSQYPASSLAA